MNSGKSTEEDSRCSLTCLLPGPEGAEVARPGHQSFQLMALAEPLWGSTI